MLNNENVNVNVEVKERKSFKQRIAENKEVILGVGAIVATVGGAILLERYIHHSDLKRKVSSLESMVRLNDNRVNWIESSVSVLENAVSNSGIVLEQAKKTVIERKEALAKQLADVITSDQVNEALVETLKEGIGYFDELLNNFENLEFDAIQDALDYVLIDQ